MMRGAVYRGAKTISQRFEVTARLLREQSTLVYLYVPELDQIAHSQGWQSNVWIDRLEEVDSLSRELANTLPKGTGLLLTADHGVVDVPRERQVYLDEIAVPASTLRR